MSWSHWLLGPWPGDLLPEAGCPDKGVSGEVGSAAGIVPSAPQVRTQSCFQCLLFPPQARVPYLPPHLALSEIVLQRMAWGETGLLEGPDLWWTQVPRRLTVDAKPLPVLGAQRATPGGPSVKPCPV